MYHLLGEDMLFVIVYAMFLLLKFSSRLPFWLVFLLLHIMLRLLKSPIKMSVFGSCLNSLFSKMGLFAGM